MVPILWLALLLSGLQSRGAPASTGTRSSISGLVVRAEAAAGAPNQLAEARVELKPGNMTAFTNGGGTFAFGNLAPGQYTISFSHDGYIPQEDHERGLTLSGLTVTVVAGKPLRDVRLPMIPAPVITGKVFDPHGKPLAAALVRAYRRLYTPYGTQLKAVKKGMTNDMGEFRLFGLNFGNYFVSGGYGDRDRAAAIGRTQLSANVAKADDGFATMFYDGDEDISRAQPAQLAPGAPPAELNIYLRDSARFKIRGQVLPPASGTRILLAPKGSDLTQADFSTQPNAGGAFEIRGVSPGSYVLLATADDGNLMSEVIAINVSDRDVDGIRLTLQRTMSASGVLSLEGTPRANLSSLRIKLLRSSTEFEQEIEVPVGGDGTFTLEHVAPLAEYDIALEPLPPGTYVKSITSASLNILQGRSRLLPNQPLRILLALATEGIDVRVTKGNDPAAGIQVVLIPEVGLRRRPERYITGFTTSSGEVRLTGVPPGEYTAYAFEDIAPGAYYALAYNPASQNRLRDRAVPVTVGENGTKAIQLKVILAAETAGLLQ